MAKFSNDLTDAQLERLAILSEELGEAQQAIGKIIRHGYHSWNPEVVGKTTNRDDLAKELGDVQYAIDRLIGHDDIDGHAFIKRMHEKPGKIAKYLHHQPKVGV